MTENEKTEKVSSTDRSIRQPFLALICIRHGITINVAGGDRQRARQLTVSTVHGSGRRYGVDVSDSILIGIIDQDVQAIDGRVTTRSFVLLVTSNEPVFAGKAWVRRDKLPRIIVVKVGYMTPEDVELFYCIGNERSKNRGVLLFC